MTTPKGCTKNKVCRNMVGVLRMNQRNVAYQVKTNRFLSSNQELNLKV